jgi:tetratricopeptide (TPR) repeat protein
VRRFLLVTLFASGLLLLPASRSAQATNTTKRARLRVTLHDGTVHEGSLVWKKKLLEVKGSRKRKVAYGDISEISASPLKTDKELRAEFAKRHKALKKDDLAGLLKLGKWARELDLEEEALDAFEAALKLDEGSAEAHQGVGEILGEDGKWMQAGLLLSQRRAKLDPKDHNGLVDLAGFAFSKGQRQAGFGLLVEVLVADTYQERALKMAGRYTSAHRQSLDLIFPLSGSWRASKDRTRHHQKKAYATYALDLTKINSAGRLYKGRGKRLKDWYTWGKPFYAVADGTVVEVRDGRPDNPIGKIGDAYEKHNGVSLDHGDGLLSWYVHAKKGSVRVKLGQRVKQGEILGEVGNSGGSATPHLHFTLIAFRRLSVPWRCKSFEVIAPDGTPLRVKDAWPREGWTIKAKTPPPVRKETGD